LKRTEKEELVGMLADIFNSAEIGFLADYRGLSVADVTDLRRRLHEASTGMRVLKNRIAKIAIKDTPFEPLGEHLTEPRALIYGTDPVAPAKVITKYQGENEKFKVLHGLLVTKGVASVLDAGQIKSLGALPSREELIAQLMSVMNGSLVKLVSTLNEIPAKFVRTLSAVAQQKGES
jgi:large subunit ribosomal protein L10